MSAEGLEFLYRVSGIVSSDLQLEEMLSALIRLAGEVTGCDACLVYLPEPDGAEVVLRASQLPHSAEIGRLRIKMGEGVTGWVAEHASVVALDREASTDPRFKTINTLVEDTFEALLSVPPFTIFKVFKKLLATSLEFTTIPEERAVAFPAESLAGLSARITYSGYSEQAGDLLFQFKLSKDGQTLLEPTIRLSGAPLPLVVPWPDPMNVLIFVFQCTAKPETPAAPAAAQDSH